MTDKDIAKLVTKLNATLASKDDLKDLEVKLRTDLGSKIDGVEASLRTAIEEVNIKLKTVANKLSAQIKEVNEKADTILKYADEIEKTTDDHEKRLNRIEVVPVIAHEIDK